MMRGKYTGIDGRFGAGMHGWISGPRKESPAVIITRYIVSRVIDRVSREKLSAFEGDSPPAGFLR